LEAESKQYMKELGIKNIDEEDDPQMRDIMKEMKK